MKYSKCSADGSAKTRILIRKSQVKIKRNANAAQHCVERKLLAAYIQVVAHVGTDC